jgi:hypothetical protein
LGYARTIPHRGASAPAAGADGLHRDIDALTVGDVEDLLFGVVASADLAALRR